jgi:hypothetical protein
MVLAVAPQASPSKYLLCAFTQSTKLCIHEERVLELVLETKHMPQSLAQHGTVTVTAEEVAQRIGQVFIQRVCSLRVATNAAGTLVVCAGSASLWACLPCSAVCSSNIHCALAQHAAVVLFHTLRCPPLGSRHMLRSACDTREQNLPGHTGHPSCFWCCFVQAAVNLLGSVLDTPEFFWSAPDQLQVGSGGVGQLFS